MEDENISQYVLNALNELKQLAKEKYELYILFINSYEQRYFFKTFGLHL